MEYNEVGSSNSKLLRVSLFYTIVCSAGPQFQEITRLRNHLHSNHLYHLSNFICKSINEQLTAKCFPCVALCSYLMEYYGATESMVQRSSNDSFLIWDLHSL